MSTHATVALELTKLLQAGKLHEYLPAYTDPDFVQQRHIYMSEEAFHSCPPTGQPSLSKLRGQALINCRSQLEAFVGGEEMVRDEDLKLLQPNSDDVWEIRVYEKPHVRLFGWFICPDHFVVTHLERRDGLDGRWEIEMQKSKNKRQNLFGSLPVHQGRSFHDYITTNGVE